MSNVYIVGLGMIRFNKYPDRNVRDMAHEVIRLAIEDAELKKEERINCLRPDQPIPSTIAPFLQFHYSVQ